MTAVAPAIENMTLNITEEILVRSSLAKTFAAEERAAWLIRRRL